MNAPLNAGKPAMQNQSSDQSSIYDAELGVELLSNESTGLPVQAYVTCPGAILADPAIRDTAADEFEEADSCTSTALGDDVPLSESSSKAGYSTQQSAEGIVQLLASLDSLEYDKKRQEMANSLGIRLSTLDSAVKAAKVGQSESGSMPFPDVEPHPEPIDPAELLSAYSGEREQ